jgi:hypothetical protein
MELLVLWCKAQAAQRRLRDNFKASGKPNEEPRLKATEPSLSGTVSKRPEGILRSLFWQTTARSEVPQAETRT